MNTTKILIVGANGQLGSVLTQALQNKYGFENVIASDLRPKLGFDGYFEELDATNFQALQSIVKKYQITQIYHLAAILSANGEKDPLRTWEINMRSLLNVLEVGRIEQIDRIFYPSTIAVFGNLAPKEVCPQFTFLDPSTVYGISKSSGENWANYYFNRYGLDVRSLRYPGVIGYQSLPGGGTTDYAIDIFHKAVADEPYTCFLAKDTRLPMIFMDDAIKATLQLMEAPKEAIKTRTSYNLAGLSFTPEEIATEIKKVIPNFVINYEPDFRQNIAASWPQIIDDKEAQADWNWQSSYTLKDIVEIMIHELKQQLTFA
ncbi:NAD-dependent epimerase/dehydratase [Emticicia oligotrophica DSM 17448]|uniref:NAD-dependent epimerase/dehydratase n=1 Tax=Emticicia oligotrophica (strain DSM 17448 / CIP 109782 / MTCC 6937 / GPTSA100-15) TaxID=929562 RepID=A0ABM5N4P4_EMTOG|nr:NAD-dependent epimerase/dehydratase family protein [Emticicia oligotrophica]AFK04477.1 NAD-dependent epimerase/dehydratase [Emticicia oligotrophica DSM 17448]